MKPLTVDILVKCGADRQAAARYVDVLTELLPYYRVDTLLRLSHFLGQILAESNRLKAVREYASGAAYEGRKDLGNTQPGDGVRFAGRGLIQTTGRVNYTAFARKFGIDCVNHPELLEEPRWAVASALWYWGTRSLNTYSDRDDIYSISCLINLGHVPRPKSKRKVPNGYDMRQLYVKQSKAALAKLF